MSPISVQTSQDTQKCTQTIKFAPTFAIGVLVCHCLGSSARDKFRLLQRTCCCPCAYCIAGCMRAGVIFCANMCVCVVCLCVYWRVCAPGGPVVLPQCTGRRYTPMVLTYVVASCCRGQPPTHPHTHTYMHAHTPHTRGQSNFALVHCMLCIVVLCILVCVGGVLLSVLLHSGYPWGRTTPGMIYKPPPE